MGDMGTVVSVKYPESSWSFWALMKSRLTLFLSPNLFFFPSFGSFRQSPTSCRKSKEGGACENQIQNIFEIVGLAFPGFGEVLMACSQMLWITTLPLGSLESSLLGVPGLWSMHPVCLYPGSVKC